MLRCSLTTQAHRCASSQRAPGSCDLYSRIRTPTIAAWFPTLLCFPSFPAAAGNTQHARLASAAATTAATTTTTTTTTTATITTATGVTSSHHESARCHHRRYGAGSNGGAGRCNHLRSPRKNVSAARARVWLVSCL